MTRPTGVTVIAVINTFGFSALAGDVLSALHGQPLAWSKLDVAKAMISVMLSVALLKMQRWARWAVVMMYAALLVSVPVRLASTHDLRYIIDALTWGSFWVWAIWHLFQPHVKAAFRIP